MKGERVSLKDYILAMEQMRQYERDLQPPEDNGGFLARCDKCGLMFPYTITEVTKRVNGGGTQIYIGECPYCGESTKVTWR